MDFEAMAQYLDQLELRQAVWLLLVAFVLHVLEETPQFKKWVNRHISTRFTWRDFLVNNGLGLAATAGLCWAVCRDPTPSLVFAFFVLAVWQCGFNILFHVVTTAIYGTYSPGLITSLVLYPPLIQYLSKLAARDELLGEDIALRAMLLGGVLHAIVVVVQVFLIPQVRRRLSNRTNSVASKRLVGVPLHS
jgi:hypothetical protein